MGKYLRYSLQEVIASILGLINNIKRTLRRRKMRFKLPKHMYLLAKKRLVVVLEHHTDKNDAKVHGIFYEREDGEDAVDLLKREDRDHGYYSILEFPIRGNDTTFNCRLEDT